MIVLAEDDVDLREMVIAVLEQSGFEVIPAEDGLDALQRLEACGGATLLVTDIRMPRLDGVRLADMAKTRWPSLKVLYMTGFADSEFVRNNAGKLHGPLLQKPFRIVDLVDEAGRLYAAG